MAILMRSLVGRRVRHVSRTGRTYDVYMSHMTPEGLLVGEKFLSEDPLTGRPRKERVCYLNGFDEDLRTEGDPLQPGEWRYIDEGQSI